MILLGELCAFLENIAPLHLQETYDNSGLLVGKPEATVHGVLTTLDCTEEVLDEAIAKHCNVIVAHHPIVFRGLKRFNDANYVERVITKAIKSDLSLYAIHTNLDNVLQNGVNERFANMLGLQNLEILAPKPGNPQIGAGILGDWLEPLPWSAFLNLVHLKMKAPLVKHTAVLQTNVQKVALCGGAGSFLLPAAIARGADVFLSSDFKYHEFFDADNKITICDIGHFETEQYTAHLLMELISGKFSTFAVQLSEVRTNPVRYAFQNP